MKYDPTVIEEFARRLLKQASSIIATWTFLGVLIGAFGGYSVLAEVGGGRSVIIACAVVGGAIGLHLGKERAFRLKLVAQTALCQVSIERNTRVTAGQVKAATQTDVRRAA